MSKVNRATYQKVVEENKRLLKDIKHLVDIKWGVDRLRTQQKWQDHFDKEKEFVPIPIME